MLGSFFRASTACALACVAACTSTNTGGAPDSGPPACTAPGGPVTGAADSHCGANVTAVDPAACHPEGGPLGDDGGSGSPYGPTMYGSEGDDDDCKYHLKWSATPVCAGRDVTFTVVATYKKGGAPLTGADPFIEQFFVPDASRPPPDASAGAKTTESPAGTYTIGPIQFDASGRWGVRFHFAWRCDDGPQSPHGHAAFFVEVP